MGRSTSYLEPLEKALSLSQQRAQPSILAPMRRISWAAVTAIALSTSCGEKGTPPAPPADASAGASAVEDASGTGPEDAGPEDAAADVVVEAPRCPPDMVRVQERFCVDRYETSLVDADSEMALSPYYPPLKSSYEKFIQARQAESAKLLADAPGGEAAAMPFPLLPGFQQSGHFKPKAISRKGATPNGYLNMMMSRDACAAVGKRLCTLEEWQTACRGERGTQFPYGDTYKQGVCNVFRENHPANVLFDNMSVGMLDPRMNKVTVKGKPLLRATGATPDCKSVWGDDAIYDMVGNLDEWVDDPEGTFAGGFYSRSSKNGCERTVKAHPASYMDYSTGGRCCGDLPAPR